MKHHNFVYSFHANIKKVWKPAKHTSIHFNVPWCTLCHSNISHNILFDKWQTYLKFMLYLVTVLTQKNYFNNLIFAVFGYSYKVVGWVWLCKAIDTEWLFIIAEKPQGVATHLSLVPRFIKGKWTLLHHYVNCEHLTDLWRWKGNWDCGFNTTCL